MNSRILLAALLLPVALAGAQQKPVQQTKATQTATAKAPTHTSMAPAVSADSAKAIVLSHVSGATVSSEKLQTRNGHRYYLFTLREGKTRALVRATVDAANGSFTRLDKAAKQ